MTNVINGKLVAQNIYKDVLEEIKEARENDDTISLAVIVVGDNPVGQIYVNKKQTTLESLGINFKLYEFLPIATEKQITELIEKLNEDKFTHGILVQLPMPEKFDAQKILNKIDPVKDVDSLLEKSNYDSPTALAIMEILKSLQVDIKEKKIVVLGKGKLVGRPFFELAKKTGAQITACDENTADINCITQKADVIVSAVGYRGLVTKDMVNENQIIIDAGTFVENGVQYGDTDFENIKDEVAAITPAKGGVGPVTIACLAKNLVKAYKNQKNS